MPGSLAAGIIVSLPTGILALTLWANQVPLALWIALAVGLAAWGFLARRVLAQSLTLTAGTVVIRNIFATERIALADVTEVGFHRGKLIVTWRRAAFVPVRTTVGTAILGSSYWSGRRAAPTRWRTRLTTPPDSRRSRPAGRSSAPAEPGCYCSPRRWSSASASTSGRCKACNSTAIPSPSAKPAPSCTRGGITALAFAYRLTRDHRRKRRAQSRP